MLDLTDGREIYQKINLLREQKGLSWYEISKRTGLSRSIFNLWRESHAMPTLTSLDAVCEALGISFLDFLSDGEEPIALEEEQRQLLRIWNQLSKQQQQALLHLLQKMHE